jgi:hypothetical protein
VKLGALMPPTILRSSRHSQRLRVGPIRHAAGSGRCRGCALSAYLLGVDLSDAPKLYAKSGEYTEAVWDS